MKRIFVIVLVLAACASAQLTQLSPGNAQQVQGVLDQPHGGIGVSNGSPSFASVVVGNGLPADATVLATVSDIMWDATNHRMTACNTNTVMCQGFTRLVANTSAGTGTGGCGGGGISGGSTQCVFPIGGSGVVRPIASGTEGNIVITNSSGVLTDLGSNLLTSISTGSTVEGILISAVVASQGTVLPWPAYRKATIQAADVPAVTVVLTTTSSVTVSTTLNFAFYYNQHATAATAVAYNLPTAAAGKELCFGNSYNGTAANTGVLTINTSASGQFLIDKDGTLGSTGGHITSGGAGGDSGCVVGVDATHWQWYPGQGTWTKN